MNHGPSEAHSPQIRLSVKNPPRNTDISRIFDRYISYEGRVSRRVFFLGVRKKDEVISWH